MATTGRLDRSRLAWWSIGAGLVGVLAFVLYSFIGTFVFGVFIYYATRPVYARVRRRVRPPSLAAALSLLLLALPVLLLVAYTLAIGLQEAGRFARRYGVDSIETYVGPYLDLSAIPLTPEEMFTGDAVAAIGDLLGQATAYVGFLGTGLLHLFVMIAIAFYLLRDDHRLSRWVRRRFSDEAGVLEVYLDAVDRSYHQVFFGNILNAVLTGTIGALAYSLLAVAVPPAVAIPYPALLGLLAGIASLIPVIGMKLVYFPATIYLLAVVALARAPDLLWVPVGFFLLSFIVVDTIPDFVLRPYVSGRSLHVGMVMFAYIFGPLLFGWYGIFLGPMLLVLVFHFARLVLPELAAGVPLRPVAVDPTHLTVGSSSGGSEAGEPSTGPDG